MPTDTLTTILELQGVGIAITQLKTFAQEATNASRATDNLAASLNKIGKLFAGSAGLAGPSIAGGGGAPWSPSAIAGMKQAVPEMTRLQSLMEILGQRAGGTSRLFGQLTALMGGTTGAFLAIAGAGAIVSQAIDGIARAIGAAMDAGDKLNQSLARTLLLFNNSGRAATPGGISSFAMQRMGQAGIAPGATMDLMGQLAERGFAPQHIQQLTRAGQEIEAGTGGRTNAMRAIEMFMRGEFQTERQRFTRQGMLGMAGGRAQMQMGTRLGLSIRFTGNIERDLEAFVQAVESKFGGITEALNRTASGVHLRVQTELATATGQLGQVIEAGLLPAMEGLASVLQAFNQGVSFLLNGGGNANQQAVVGGFQNWLTAAFPFLGLGLAEAQGRMAALNQVDPSGIQRRQLDHLANIDAAMGGLVRAMVAVFGHTGNFTQQAFAWDYQHLNAAVKTRT